MAYQVLARKWRPKKYADVIGQSHITQSIQNALKINKVGHAYLMVGTRGVGKTTVARLFARSLRCENLTETLDACGKCQSCQEFDTDSSMNVVEIDGASNNSVDNIRDLISNVQFLPTSGNKKVYIIDEVHMLSSSAFNALLKTLEEPPAHVIFIFATTEANKIPITVLSRCQRFDFRPIPSRKIAEHLKYICDQEKFEYEEDALWILAREAQGSMRDSLSLLDQVISFTNAKLNNDNILNALGLTDRRLLLDCLSALLNRDATQNLEIVRKLYFAGQDPKVFIQDLIEELRHLLLVKLQPKDLKQIVDLPDAELKLLYELAQATSEEDIHLLFDMALKGAADLIRANDSKIVLEMLLLRMASAPKLHFFFGSAEIPESTTNSAEKKTEKLADSTQSVSNLDNKMDTNVNSTAISAALANSVEPSSELNLNKTNTNKPEVPHIETKEQNLKQEIALDFPKHIFDANKSLTQNWLELVDTIKLQNPIISAKLEHASAQKLERGILFLQFPKSHSFLAQQWMENTNKAKLLQDLQRHWHLLKNLEISWLMEQDASALNPMQLKMNEKQKAEQELMDLIHNNHIIQSVKTIFQANVKEVKELK